MVTNGWKQRKHNKTLVEKERVEYELNVIEQKGYSGYFCIVADYINWAKQNDIIVGAGRGSAAGSFVSYLSNIVDVNPVEHGLLFQRFLNPERQSSPDIDVDFSNQPKVFSYLKERWGYDKVSLIMAFGTLTAKAVFSKVLSIHGFQNTQIKQWTKTFPKILDLELKHCEDTEAFRTLRKTHNHLIEAMYRLEGVIDHITKHAAGVLITPKPISDFAPVIYDTENDMQIVGYDKYMLEAQGFYKFDILKLSTLNVIEDTINLVKQHKGDDISFDTITYDDDNVYSDLCTGNVFGVFQLSEQPEMTKQIEPVDFVGLTALNALIRPSAVSQEYIERKNGKEFKYYSDLELTYMKQTYGVLVYQEQVMLRVHTLAGWSLGKGDSLRKEKDIKNNKELKNKYTMDCIERGYANNMLLEDINNSWNDICTALDGGYSFNLSHACVYADIAYKTAWLKYYYPLEFMCALMSNKYDDSEVLAERVTQCKQLGIVILPPDINNASNKLTIENNAIRFALGSISGVGDEALEDIKSIQPITSFDYFINSINSQKCDMSVVINLIKAGCFEFTGQSKLELILYYLTFKKQKKKLLTYQDIVYNDSVKLQWEREALGLYLSKSPLDDYNFKAFDTYSENDNSILGGEVIKKKEVIDKNKNQMAFITLNTQYNNVECVVFASTYNDYKQLLNENELVMIQGKKSNGKLLVNKVTRLG
jgi:DNA polymerase-3 subunit alpha